MLFRSEHYSAMQKPAKEGAVATSTGACKYGMNQCPGSPHVSGDLSTGWLLCHNKRKTQNEINSS